MKKSPFLFVLCASFLVSNSVFANINELLANFPWVGTISLGPTWNSGNGENQTFFLSPEEEKSYRAKNSNNALVDGEVFIGLQKKQCYPFLPFLQSQLGVAFVATGNANLSGAIWDDANPEFNNHTYQYKIRHKHVALKGKLLVENGYCLIPWISVSMGIGFNTAYDFENTPTNFEALPSANFSSNTQTTFTYTLSAGVQKPLNKNWQVGIGYEFADWGKSKLGRATGQTMNEGLTLNHLYTNGILFNLTYLA